MPARILLWSRVDDDLADLLASLDGIDHRRVRGDMSLLREGS